METLNHILAAVLFGWPCVAFAAYIANDMIERLRK